MSWRDRCSRDARPTCASEMSQLVAPGTACVPALATTTLPSGNASQLDVAFSKLTSSAGDRQMFIVQTVRI